MNWTTTRLGAWIGLWFALGGCVDDAGLGDLPPGSSGSADPGTGSTGVASSTGDDASTGSGGSSETGGGETGDPELSPCEQAEVESSAAGCAFVVNRPAHPYPEWPDGLMVANPSDELDAGVTVFEVPEGGLDEEPFESFNLAPGEVRIIELASAFVPASGTNLRTGGLFRLYSDNPVVGHLYAPLRSNRGNESALLIPDHALGTNYVAAAYSSLVTAFQGESYFEVVSLEDDTTVTWRPRIDTAGSGLPVSDVAAGGEGTLVLNRYETLRVTPSLLGVPNGDVAAFESLDVSGTVVTSDRPISVAGGNRFARVPLAPVGGGGSGDPLFEIMVPVDRWGANYVLPAAIARPWEFEPPAQVPEWADYVEASLFRIYAGADGVTVTSDPPRPEFPIVLDGAGDFIDVEVPPGVSLFLSGDGPFLPVQAVRSHAVDSLGVDGAPQTGHGDSAMVQLVANEQFQTGYAFATGVGYFYNHARVVRAVSQDELRIVASTGEILRVCSEPDCDFAFQSAGADHQVAVVPLAEGFYTAQSETPFGLILSGSARGVGNDEDGFPLDTQCEAATAENPICFSSYAHVASLGAPGG